MIHNIHKGQLLWKWCAIVSAPGCVVWFTCERCVCLLGGGGWPLFALCVCVCACARVRVCVRVCVCVMCVKWTLP